MNIVPVCLVSSVCRVTARFFHLRHACCMSCLCVYIRLIGDTHRMVCGRHIAVLYLLRVSWCCCCAGVELRDSGYSLEPSHLFYSPTSSLHARTFTSLWMRLLCPHPPKEREVNGNSAICLSYERVCSSMGHKLSFMAKVK